LLVAETVNIDDGSDDVIMFLLIIHNCNDSRLEMGRIPYILLSRMLGWSRYQETRY